MLHFAVKGEMAKKFEIHLSGTRETGIRESSLFESGDGCLPRHMEISQETAREAQGPGGLEVGKGP